MLVSSSSLSSIPTPSPLTVLVLLVNTAKSKARLIRALAVEAYEIMESLPPTFMLYLLRPSSDGYFVDTTSPSSPQLPDSRLPESYLSFRHSPAPQANAPKAVEASSISSRQGPSTGGPSYIVSRAVLHLDASAMSKRANETPHGERSEPRGVEAGASEREIRIAELRLGLKLKAGPLPSITSVAVALELATGNEQAIQNLPSGGAARKRARKLCDRIAAEGLLQDSHFCHRRRTASMRFTVEGSLFDPYVLSASLN